MVIVVAGAAAGGYFLFLREGGEGGAAGGVSTEHVSKVPSDVDMIVSADITKLLHEAGAQEISDKALSIFTQQYPSPGLPSSYQELIDKLKENLGLSPQGLKKVTLFGSYPSGSFEGTEFQYMALLFSASWSENEVVEAYETTGGDLEKSSYRDVVIYKQAVGPEELAGASSLAVLGEGIYALGSENAVEDVIDTMGGRIGGLSGSLKQQYDRTIGYIRFAFRFPSERVPTGGGSGFAAQIFGNIRYISGSFSTNDSNIKFEFYLKAPDESKAGDLKDAIDGIINLLKLRSSEIVKSELDKVDITQDGTTVEITYTTTVDDLKQLMDAVRNLTSPTM